MKTLGLVVARKGSRRVPGKNEREFCGHPLVAWTIVQSICSHGVDGTFLSTDGDNLAAIGEKYGAQVIRRPDWGDADYVPANVPYMHMLGILREVYPEAQAAVCYLPTSPLRKPNDTDRCLDAFYNTRPWPGRCAQVTPIIPQPETVVLRPIQGNYYTTEMFNKSWRYAVQGGGMSVTDINEYIRDNQVVARERWTDAMLDGLIEDKDRHLLSEIFKNDVMRYVAMDMWQQFEIDEEEEFRLCELMMEAFILKGRGMDVYYEYAKEKPSAD